jgi:ABC-type sugar transport system ATPase subunit
VRALDGVTFDARHGEIHALLGENGAGKSTLVKLLVGLEQPDSGSIAIEGQTVRIRSPRDARAHGIKVIPQEVDACRELSVGRNMLLGVEGPVVRRGRLSAGERRRVDQAFETVGARVDPRGRAGQLSVPELRLVQIAKALTAPGSIVLCDEPTAVLSEADADILLERLVGLRDQAEGAIVYVSHRLSEVLRIADRITVLRDGRNVGTFSRGEVDRQGLIDLMAKTRTGRGSLDEEELEFVSVETTGVLEACNLELGRELRDVSLTVRSGQVVGVVGVQGAGHGALLSAIAGRQAFEAGKVRLDGRELAPGALQAAYKAGIALVPADRRQAGIAPAMSVRENISLPASQTLAKLGVRNRREERRVARTFTDTLDIRGAGPEALASGLSGGNQQKVALARVIQSHPRFLLLEEPTQGIDVSAKAEIRELVATLARDRGLGVLVATSEFEDVLGFADVIHVMCLGRLVATVDGRKATYAELLQHALP